MATSIAQAAARTQWRRYPALLAKKAGK